MLLAICVLDDIQIIFILNNLYWINLFIESYIITSLIIQVNPGLFRFFY